MSQKTPNSSTQSDTKPTQSENIPVINPAGISFEELKEKYNILLTENMRYRKSFQEMDSRIEEKPEETKKTEEITQKPSSPSKYFSLQETFQTSHQHIAPRGLCTFQSQEPPHIISVGCNGAIERSIPLVQGFAEKLNDEKINPRTVNIVLSAIINQEQLLFIGEMSGRIEIVNFTKKKVKYYSKHTGCIFSIIFLHHPKIEAMVSTESDKMLHIWNPSNLKTLFSLSFNEIPMRTCYLQNKHQIVVGFSSGTITTYNLTVNGFFKTNVNMVQQDSFPGHNRHVISLVYSSAKDLLISASNDGSVKIWAINSENKRELKTEICERANSIRNIVLMEQLDQLLINYWPQCIRAWNISTGSLLGQHEDETFGQAVTVVARNQIVTGISLTGELKLWNIPE